MPQYEVTLAKRTALRMLNNEECKIHVDKAHSDFITTPGIHEDNTVFVPKENILVPILDISKIEVTNRFTDKTIMMTVDWED